MPRGRHRQSSPLSRLLPPTACGVLAIASLISAAFTGDPSVLRVLVVAASVGAFAGAVLLRLREHTGQVDLEAEIAARARDEARFEDRVAELEFQAETAEEQVKRLDRRLLAQRSQLTRIEAENARLLRERARIAADQALREAEEARRREAAARGIRPTPTAYLKAAAALRGLERRAAVGQAQRIAAQATAPAPRRAVAAGAAPQQAPQGSALDALAAATARQHPSGEPALQPAATKPAPAPSAPAVAPVTVQPGSPQPKAGPAWARAALPPMRPASAVLPGLSAAPGRQSRDLLRKDAGSSGTFNFFSRQETAISTRLGDLADVVGDEAAAAQNRYVAAQELSEAPLGVLPDAVHDRSAAAVPQQEAGPGQVELVDLTADDETEPIDVRVLRAL